MTKRKFFHNYLHDLESVWWIAMYSLFYTLPADEVKDQVYPDEKLQQELVADLMFPTSIEDPLHRTLFMEHDTTFESSTTVLPQAYEMVVRAMHVALSRLRESYEEIEAKHEIPSDRKQYAGFYDSLIECFEKAEELAVDEIRCIRDVRTRLKAQTTPKTNTTVQARPTASKKRTGDEQLDPLDAPAPRECKRPRKGDSISPLRAMPAPSVLL